jgi:hypothetical protein
VIHRGGAEGAEKIDLEYQREQSLCERRVSVVNSLSVKMEEPEFCNANLPKRILQGRELRASQILSDANPDNFL